MEQGRGTFRLLGVPVFYSETVTPTTKFSKLKLSRRTEVNIKLSNV